MSATDKNNIEDYGLDLHCSMILEEYRERMECYVAMRQVVLDALNKCLTDNNILVTAVEARIKTEHSLAGKLELKGYKYGNLEDITDVLGARVISFYTDEVDKIAALCENIFDVDWENSVDKRKLLGKDSFGYMSLHYICRIPKSLYSNPEYPFLNDIRFEIQLRTTLQHAWANMNHDTGYKSGVEIPSEYSRALVRLAGLLELADAEFCRIRSEINEYRRKVESLVSDGNFDEVELNFDTFKSYLATEPFDKLNKRIADINQAEIQHESGMFYLNPLIFIGLKTLGDVERLKNDYSEAAYELALHQMSGTDLDIISSTLGLQNICFCYMVDSGMGIRGIVKVLDLINGPRAYNEDSAQRIFNRVNQLPFILRQNKNKE